MTRVDRGKRHDEGGAVTVMFAILATLMLGVAALSLDLGNAYQRRAETQSQADLAALAGGSALDTSQSAAIARVVDYLKHNAKTGQGTSAPTAAQMTDGVVANGEVTFPTTTSMKVRTPNAMVTFGFARVLGKSSTSVASTATVAMGTPGASSAVPYYAVGGSGCDFGAQALTDPANGQAVGTLPTNLQTPSQGGSVSATLNSLSVPQLASGLTTANVVINGNQLASASGVGFYRETTETPNRVETGAPTATAFANGDSTGKTFTVAVPSTVLATDGVWYVRIYKAGNGSGNTGWSTTALPLRIGDPLIACGSLSNSGNFGALKLPRTDVSDSTSNGWMPTNIAVGLQSPLTLKVHAQAAAPWTCSGGVNGAIYSTVTGSPTLKPDTNCVSTDTGLTATATTAGLVTGTSLMPGRLTKAPTGTGVLGRNCGPGHSAANRTLLGEAINNDTLTCYMVNPATPLSTIASPSYSAGPALDPSIYNSPRFLYVPVVRTDPSSGRSFNYSMVDMRPAFITGELNNSTYNSQVFSSSTDNGLMLNDAGNKITSLGVVFFNSNALPTDAIDLGNYIGTGPRSMGLVD